jgi:hypothetical protein
MGTQACSISKPHHSACQKKEKVYETAQEQSEYQEKPLKT